MARSKDGTELRIVISLCATVAMYCACGWEPSTAHAAASSPACFELDPAQPWNQPAPSQRHSQSGEYVAHFWREASDRPGNLNVSPNYAVYRAVDATARYHVRAERGNMDDRTLPFSQGWTAHNFDKQIVVIDTRPGFAYEFFGAAVDDKTATITARRGDHLEVDSVSEFGHAGNLGSRGVGIPYISMLVLDCEIQAGKIAHALSLRVGRPKCNEAWWPAVKVENHDDCRDDGIPEGARFVVHLNEAKHAAWLAGLRTRGGAPLEAFGRALADALQTYGFFITDNGAGISEFDVQSAETWTDSNPLKRLALERPNQIRDMLDGLLEEANFTLVAEQGPRLFKPKKE